MDGVNRRRFSNQDLFGSVLARPMMPWEEDVALEHAFDVWGQEELPDQ